MQPSLRSVKTRQHAIASFKGLCQRATVPDGYFADTENLSAAGYPALTPRGKRGVIGDCSSITAMFKHNEMVWLDGSQLYYGSIHVGSLVPGKKQFASLGALIIIYPDKICLDSENLTLSNLNCSHSAANVTATPCNAAGQASSSSSYVKLAASGIGVGFKVGDGVKVSGFSRDEINGNFVLQTVENDFLVILAALDSAFTESGSVSISRTAPDLDFLCSLNNRVWGCRAGGHEVYACKLGDPTNWNCFEGISTDSYVATVPSPGLFTGLTSNLGNVIFFKQEEIIKLYGTKPSNFQLVSSRMPGIAPGASASLAYTDSTLFYLGVGGVYAYDGSAPVLISQPLGDVRLINGCAGTLDGRYYLSALNVATNSWELLVYDAPTGIWQRENGGQARFFVHTSNDLYFALTDSKIYSVRQGGLWYSTAIVPIPRLRLLESSLSWYAESAAIPLSLPNGHYVARLGVRLALANSASTLTISMRTSLNDEWHTLGTFTGPREEVTVTLPLHARRATSLYFRLAGNDACTVRALTWTYETGGDA